VALGAIATFITALAALGIAIWGSWLGALAFKPKLRVSINMAPPDCMKMLAILERRGDYTGYTNSYQCRLRITNDGNRPARNVEVRLRSLDVVPDGGPGREDRTFVPMSLLWTNSEGLARRAEQVTASRIEPKLDKQCNLCSTIEYESANPLLNFATEVDPTPIQAGVYANRKPPGNYLLHIAIAADNARVVYKTLRISFAGWIDDEGEMFRKGLVIEIVR
jgi:hypothetical protein